MERIYQSRFGADGPITFAQMASEAICARQAKICNKTLPRKFWNLPEWKRRFRLQVMYCNSLLARFPPDVIGAVLRSPEGLRICTLRNPQLVPLIEAEVRRREQNKTIAAAREEPPVHAAPASGLPQQRPQLPRPGSLFGSLS